MEEGLTYPNYNPTDDGDFCNSILSRFSESMSEDHQHLCAVVGAMSLELKEQNLPTTSVAYFGATCSSLDRLSSEPESSNHVIGALLTILSLLLPRISAPILIKRRDFVSALVVRVLRLPSSTMGATTSALKCVSHLLVIGDNVSWSEISQLYSLLLGFVTDSRPKVKIDFFFLFFS